MTDLEAVLLSVQKSMLGEVSAGLRGITVAAEDGSIQVRCFYEADPAEADSEAVSCLEGDLMVEFPEAEVDVSIQVIAAPQPMPALTRWAYLRRE